MVAADSFSVQPEFHLICNAFEQEDQPFAFQFFRRKAEFFPIPCAGIGFFSVLNTKYVEKVFRNGDVGKFGVIEIGCGDSQFFRIRGGNRGGGSLNIGNFPYSV